MLDNVRTLALKETRAPMSNISRCLFQLVTVACGVAAGCGDSNVTVSDDQSERATLAVSRSMSSDVTIGDGASHPPVMLRWGIARSSGAEEVTEFISAEIENTYDDDVSVSLSMRGMGLDQRIAMAPLGQYTLRAYETRTIRILLDDLPLQSVGAPGQIELVGTSSGPLWTDARLSVDAIYIQYTPDYNRAFASARSTWAPVALALVDGDKWSSEYFELLGEPSMTVRVRASPQERR